jgi:hypothetical protein
LENLREKNTMFFVKQCGKLEGKQWDTLC